MTHVIEARRAVGLSAVLETTAPLRYTLAEQTPQLPPFARAGSALRRWGGRLVIVQDDVHALGLLDEASGELTPLLLPAGADGRHVFGEALGNKALKMDLEACITLPDGRLVALGSGSTSARERVVVVSRDHAVRLVDGAPLYRALRERVDFAGSELNIEGAVVSGGTLRLFQRGNGAPRAGLRPTNAMGDLDLDAFVAFVDGGPAPALRGVTEVHLGEAKGVAFGFTDACALPDGRMAILAGAENSPDTYRDGEVVGCRFGVLEGRDLQYVDILEPDGTPTLVKLEGIEWTQGGSDGDLEFAVVADMDDVATPARVGRLRVHSVPG